MLIDCDSCAARGRGCPSCPVQTLFDTPDGITGLQPGELRAIEMFELAGFDVELLATPSPPRQVPAQVPVRIVPIGRHVA
ncbi:MAG TPA: hypothetical protein VFO77_16455 [Actinoplanes sp.]|nr:hypothetical protein [Actinoplanes sp.]